ncbi:MAG TPA: hypothetical protein VF518_05410, partial [Polyangia bacterium]
MTRVQTRPGIVNSEHHWQLLYATRDPRLSIKGNAAIGLWVSVGRHPQHPSHVRKTAPARSTPR